jgi:UDP-GlcNAc:undecaprenyl-phosphate GlcNAc-1-phosphate transferase
MDSMRTYLFAFFVTALATALFTPIALRIALKVGAVSVPGGRNVNARSVPRLGGIAIAAASATTLIGLLALNSHVASTMRAHIVKILGLVAGSALMFALGVLDDTKRVRALYKLYAQIAASIIAFAAGFRIEIIYLPLVGNLQMGIFALPVTIIWIVAITNAINLIDGLDGLAGGVVFFAGVTNFIIAYLTGNELVATVMGTMLGAVVGFLFFNFNPARIFMGDSGSYFLGFLLGATGIATNKTTTAVAMLAPMLALGVPIFDVVFTVLRRFLERRPIFSPDRGHIHHRLLDAGLTHRRAVLTLYGASVVFTIAALAVSLGRGMTIGLGLGGACLVLLVLVRFADTERVRHALPALVEGIRVATTPAALWTAFEAGLHEARMVNCELRGSNEAVIQSWIVDRETPAHELVSARFPLTESDASSASLVFRWTSTEGRVPPQTEILLQVLVDAVGGALLRLGSELVPKATPVAERRAMHAAAARLQTTHAAE